MGSSVSSSNRAQAAANPSDSSDPQASATSNLTSVVVNQEAKKQKDRNGDKNKLTPAKSYGDKKSLSVEDKKEYYYVEKTPTGKRKAGPFTLEEMRNLFTGGSLDPFSLVWHKSFGSTWKHASDIPELLLQKATRDRVEADSEVQAKNYEALIIASRDGNHGELARLLQQYQSMVWS